MNSAYIKKQYDGEIPADLYECIYDAEFETDDLERIYAEFNSNKPRPENYTGHSISVSDIIEIVNENGSDFYICEPIGFKKIEFKK